MNTRPVRIAGAVNATISPPRAGWHQLWGCRVGETFEVGLLPLGTDANERCPSEREGYALAVPSNALDAAVPAKVRLEATVAG